MKKYEDLKKVKKTLIILFSILMIVIFVFLFIHRCDRYQVKEETIEIIELKDYNLMVTSNNDSYGEVQGSGTYKEGSLVTISAKEKEGYYFEKWDDGDVNINRTITINSDMNIQAIFKEGITVNYNGYRLIVVNGNVEDKGDYYLLTPINNRSFGYWYKDDVVDVVANDVNNEEIKVYKEDLSGDIKYTGVDSLVGHAMFSLNSDDLDEANSFSDLLTRSESFYSFLQEYNDLYYDYSYYYNQEEESRGTTITKISDNEYNIDSVVGIGINGVGFVHVKLILAGNSLKALYPIVQPYMGMEGASLSSVMEIDGVTFNYTVSFELR